MKNNLFVILMSVLIIALVSVIVIFRKNDTKFLQEISVSELKTKLNNNESFVLYVKQENCSHCLEFTPVMEKVTAQYQYAIYMINLTNLGDDKDEFNNLVTITGTPTTIFYKNGKELSESTRIVGSKSKSSVIEKLKSLGYLK